MNEQEKAKRYDTLMSEYIRLENMISAVPQLSLDEQEWCKYKEKHRRIN